MIDDIITPISVFLVLVLGIYTYILTCFNNVPVIVTVDGQKVYEGISAGVSINSGGATTTVTLRDGFMYLFPKAYYTSKDVHLENKL